MGQLMEALELIAELEETSGKNDKEIVLKKGRNNEIFREMFYFCYNPFLKYHVFKFDSKPNEEADRVKEEHWAQFKDLLNILNKRILTGGEALAAVGTFFSKLTPPEHEVFKRILQKDLNVGATIKTFNSVFPNSIPVFEVMLAKEKKKVKKLPKLVAVEPKLDGYRAVTIVQNGEATQWTRNGKPILGYNDICAEMSLLDDGMYDGEIVGKEDMFNDMQKSAFKKMENKQGTYYIFDYLPLAEFEAGKSSATYLKRKQQLHDKLTGKVEYGSLEHLIYVEESKPIDPNSPEIEKMYDEFLNEGFEGAMLKDVEAYYECKRSSSWLKVVPFISLDLPITGFQEGNEGTKYVGMLGAVMVEYEGNTVYVGSGWPDDLREEVWNNQDKFLGKVIEIHARQPSSNEKGEQSLRFPRFKRFRPDKD